jgi:hypothetical protein
MGKMVLIVIAAFALGPQLSAAQMAPPDKAVVAVSEPGKVAIVGMQELTATIMSIDKATRTVTLKGPRGNSVDVVAGDAVKNFDQMRVGDRVVAQYQQALTLELRKTRGSGGVTETSMAASAKPGDLPAGVMGRQITVLADVVGVDRKKSIISLKGPHGNIFDLKVQNPAQFTVVKVGDQVEAVYSEALAMAVTPAPAVAGAK